MLQNYNTTSPVITQLTSKGNKAVLVLLGFFSLTFGIYTAYINGALKLLKSDLWGTPVPESPPTINKLPFGTYGTDSVASLVDKALYFKSLLDTTQISTLELTYTDSLARRWSNLPCAATCRNGIQLGSLSDVQLAAALDVIKAATGKAANEGYDEFLQIRLADSVLAANDSGGGGGPFGLAYGSGNYYLAFLNTPSTTGGWMLQFGGHHYAANIAFNGGKVVGTTPYFMGIEPKVYTVNNVTYAPLNQERESMTTMLAGLTADQLATAKLNTTFSDCYMIPGESNVRGTPYSFPATKVGLKASNLTTAQKNLVFAAIRNYVSDVEDSSAAVLQAVYESGIDSTYIAWTGSGTSGDTSTFLNTNTNYVRIDGPRVWIEFICQNGIVFQNQIHYHTVWRDHSNDYGSDLTNTTLPLNLLSFDAAVQGKGRLLSWSTAGEKNVSHFEVQRSVNPASGFAAIGKVSSKNGSSNTYSYTDFESLNEDVIYYRLNMVDIDGNSRYSNIAAVKYNSVGKGISVYPNPASDLLTIANAENIQNATVRIINSNGKTVINSANRSGRKLNVDISKLPAGTYFIQLLNKGNVSTIKFVK